MSGPAGPGPARTGSGRALGLCCAGLVVAAAVLWVASVLPWWRVTAQVPLRGPVPVVFTGGQAWPALLGVAPVALAGVAGVPALSGWPRRLLGGLLAGLGVWVTAGTVRTVTGWAPAPTDPGYPAPPVGVSVDALRDQPLGVASAPWVALAGALVLLAAGAFVTVRERRLPRLGARFRVGHDRPASGRGPADLERDWWGQLDSGHDPTAAPRPEPGPGAAPRPGD